MIFIDNWGICVGIEQGGKSYESRWHVRLLLLIIKNNYIEGILNGLEKWII